jgi:ABC-2 type transport system permease protein
MEKKKKNRASLDIGKFMLLVFIIFALNFISSFYFKRFDLTAEKRYTLNPITKNFLDTLDEVVFVKVYLEGDFNADFTRLRDATKDMLDEFRAHSHNNIEYQFINPNENEDSKEAKELQKQLYQKGIEPTDLKIKTKDGMKSQWVFPGAIVSYRGKETVWQLFRNQSGIAPNVVVNNSVIELEYGLANSIRKLQRKRKPTVAFINGHGELDTNQTADIAAALQEYYRVTRVTLNGRFQALDGVDAIIVAQPDSVFSDKDKYILDQFIVKGGKSLWCIDQVNIYPDSLAMRGITFIQELNFDLTEFFFKRGVRFDPVLVHDMQSGMIKLNTGVRGGRPDFRLFPWLYKPLVIPLDKDTHRIVKNLEYVKLEYAGKIDTAITSPGIRKTVLLHTSRYSRTQGPNTRIGFNMVKINPNVASFKYPYLPVAVLLEGKFPSMFINRIPAKLDSLTKFKPYADKAGKMIVISDGDIIKNNYSPGSKSYFPMGYDRDMDQNFANKAFILNCVNYLLDDDGFMAIRNKDVKLRLLNRNLLAEQSGKWRFINLVFPLLFIIVIGVVQFFWRRKKYSS